MKMARASQRDMDAALEMVRAIDQLESGFMPQDESADDDEWFDSSSGNDCIKAIEILLNIAGKGSLMRAVFGMQVILDSGILDDNADTLEPNPSINKHIEFANTVREYAEKYPHDTGLYDLVVCELKKMEQPQ